jgi:hypothetical protein
MWVHLPETRYKANSVVSSPSVTFPVGILSRVSCWSAPVLGLYEPPSKLEGGFVLP